MKGTIITSENFDSIVTKSKTPVLLDFWAEWCGPCRMLAPVIDQISQEYADSLIVGKVDVDSQQMLAMTYEIESIPTIILFIDGTPVERLVGYKTKEMLCEMLDKYI